MSTVQDREKGKPPSRPGIPPKTIKLLVTLGWPLDYAEQVLLGVSEGPPDANSHPVVPLAESDTRMRMWRMAQRLRGERGNMPDDEQIRADLVELIQWASSYLAELNRTPEPIERREHSEVRVGR